MKFILTLVLLAITYFLAKMCFWANMVAAPYMSAHFQTTRCDRFISAQHDNDLVEENKLNHYVAGICAYDKAACDQADKEWEEYEQSRVTFHKWFRL